LAIPLCKWRYLEYLVMSSGWKWVKVVLSGARGKYSEIISNKFHFNYFSKMGVQNKTNQNQTKLNLINKKTKRNKFGFPYLD
jgi:hypothetical protein